MQTQETRPPGTTFFDRSYLGTVDQIRQARADVASAASSCPVVDDLVLLTSELATNAILHSRSRHRGQKFTVHVTFYVGEYVWAEVADAGGRWVADGWDEEHGRGLSIVGAIAGDGNWGIDGDEASRVVWFRLGWGQA
jgi:anti-sigma regulatory factor (Ser/Thr protein kinase)